MSLFTGLTGLRLQYNELLATDLTGATNQATAALLTTMDAAGRLLYLDNTLNVDLDVYLVNPDADSSVATNRLFAFELPTNRVLNLAEIFPGLYFDPGTQIYVSVVSGTPSSGKLRSIAWG